MRSNKIVSLSSAKFVASKLRKKLDQKLRENAVCTRLEDDKLIGQYDICPGKWRGKVLVSDEPTASEIILVKSYSWIQCLHNLESGCLRRRTVKTHVRWVSFQTIVVYFESYFFLDYKDLIMHLSRFKSLDIFAFCMHDLIMCTACFSRIDYVFYCHYVSTLHNFCRKIASEKMH